MRGDRPFKDGGYHFEFMFTPHARGSTPGMGDWLSPAGVYPACAGIDHFAGAGGKGLVCLPRMRGDRPSLYPVKSDSRRRRDS